MRRKVDRLPRGPFVKWLILVSSPSSCPLLPAAYVLLGSVLPVRAVCPMFADNATGLAQVSRSISIRLGRFSDVVGTQNRFRLSSMSFRRCRWCCDRESRRVKHIHVAKERPFADSESCGCKLRPTRLEPCFLESLCSARRIGLYELPELMLTVTPSFASLAHLRSIPARCAASRILCQRMPGASRARSAASVPSGISTRCTFA
jgi:hypothetical protein